MSDTAIKVHELSKRYVIGSRRNPSDGLRHRVEQMVRNPLQLLKPRAKRDKAGPEEFWALKDISFEIKQGEVVGFIGRNGAGKSTLLKILSRITEPTRGRIAIHGRAASLLEVGTGFHPELTGRENIFLNGAILGMSRAEVKRKFDEIVAFSEVEKFLETPVKRYSSGMYVRLAFAVAAHLEPEILIVDEVLAVGDVQFQKKCLGKMQDVSKGGRTVLFVSHNMAAVKSLCSRAVYLRDGKMVAQGEVNSLIAEYFRGGVDTASEKEWLDPQTRPGNENVSVNYVRVVPPPGHGVISIDTGAVMEIGFDNYLQDINFDCTVYVVNAEGVLLFESGHIISSQEDSRRGLYHMKGAIPPHLLNAGRYNVHVQFGKDQRYPLYRLEDAVTFEVENTLTGRGLNMSIAPGVVRPLIPWRNEYSGELAISAAAIPR